MSKPRSIFYITFIVVLAFGAKLAEGKHEKKTLGLIFAIFVFTVDDYRGGQYQS